MSDLLCPRCESRDIDEQTRVCGSCRICYDDVRAFEPRTLQHTTVRKRWVRWRERDRNAADKQREGWLLGLR